MLLLDGLKGIMIIASQIHIGVFRTFDRVWPKPPEEPFGLTLALMILFSLILWSPAITAFGLYYLIFNPCYLGLLAPLGAILTISEIRAIIVLHNENNRKDP